MNYWLISLNKYLNIYPEALVQILSVHCETNKRGCPQCSITAEVGWAEDEENVCWVTDTTGCGKEGETLEQWRDVRTDDRARDIFRVKVYNIRAK